LHEGQAALGDGFRPSSLRPFICVGLAYFVIAVIVPIVVLKTRGEKGSWTTSGTIWSFTAGLVTAIGALGIILAFKFRGSPIYVMPLVFGCAPVVNTFVTMAMSRTFKEAGPIFYAGVIVAATGAAGVMFFKPTTSKVTVVEKADTITVTRNDHGHSEEWTVQRGDLQLEANKKVAGLYHRWKPLSFRELLSVFASIGLTAICWGAYGPMLHKGQMKMGGSRMRPFLCVGLAYFLIAVLVPFVLLPIPTFQESYGGWNLVGTLWSLGGGTLGALGALGIILAFNFGGKPLFVMPLVFGIAPLINTFITVAEEGTAAHLDPLFFASLMLAIAGAVTVLIFAPKGHGPAPAGNAAGGASKEKAAAH
jgi:gas vesicle protein